ncbi:hypothetical protein FQN55_006279 [Onygenales sp. PD_40]|nr:hypothetical protein FQN55_006279 [Onygenales sp. PD_40]
MEVIGITVQSDAPGSSPIDCSVLPLLFLGLVVFQLDRMNLASALTGGFAEHVKVDQNTINLGNQMMFLGIVVLEIPSNLILQRLGPRKWIASQVFVFGIVATLQVFLVNRNGFLVSRAVLGLCEAGYIPGSIYTLSTWYTKPELAKRVALFFFVEGTFTIAVSICILVFLPGSPDNPKPLVSKGLIRFSEMEKLILRTRLESDDAEKKDGSQGLRIPLRTVGKTVLYYRRWPHFIATACVFSTWSPLTTYSPTIIMTLGFDRIRANALCAIGGFISLGVVFFFAWLSDRTNKRGLTVMAAITCYLIVLIVTKTLHPHVGKWSRFGLWTAVNSFAVGYHPIHNTWVQVNCKEPGERSISIAGNERNIGFDGWNPNIPT